jgi:hypothetical protein
MSRKDSTKQTPRRSRLPKAVYTVAEDVLSNLRGNDYLDRLADERLCEDIADHIQTLATLAEIKVESEILLHPHADPDKVEHLIKEAMRLAYGIDDLIKQGAKVPKIEERRSRRLIEAFLGIMEASDESRFRERERDRVKAAAKTEKPPPSTGMFAVAHLLTENWPKKGLHKGDYVLVQEGEQAQVKQLAWFKLKDGTREFISTLCHKTKSHYYIEGSNRVRTEISRDEIKIEGPVIAVVKACAKDYMERLLRGEIPVARPQAKPDKPKADADTARKIAELRRKMDKLDFEPENEACYFKLEKQLWQLEHPTAEEDSILDSEFIGGRGFTNREGGAQ